MRDDDAAQDVEADGERVGSVFVMKKTDAIAKQMLAVPKSRNATIERRLARLRTCALTAAIWPSN